MVGTCEHVYELKNKIQLDATYYFIMLMLGSTCFGHLYTHHQGPSVGKFIHLPALNFQPAATREPGGLCGNQRHRRELLMMGIMVPETY